MELKLIYLAQFLLFGISVSAHTLAESSTSSTTREPAVTADQLQFEAEQTVVVDNYCGPNADLVVLNYCHCNQGYAKVASNNFSLPYCKSICPAGMSWHNMVQDCVYDLSQGGSENNDHQQRTELEFELEYCDEACGPHAKCIKLRQCTCRTGYVRMQHSSHERAHCMQSTYNAELINSNAAAPYDTHERYVEIGVAAVDGAHNTEHDMDTMHASSVESEYETTTTLPTPKPTSKILLITETTNYIEKDEANKTADQYVIALGICCVVTAAIYLIIKVYKDNCK